MINLFQSTKVYHKKYPADSRKRNESGHFKYEQDCPMSKTERDIFELQKQLVPQNLNSALREIIQIFGIPKTEYAMQCLTC